MKTNLFLSLLLFLFTSVFSQNYQCVTIDSLVIDNVELTYPSPFYHTISMDSNAIYIRPHFKSDFIYVYNHEGVQLEQIKISDEKPSKSLIKMHIVGINSSGKYLNLLSTNGWFYQYDLEDEKLVKELKSSNKFNNTKFQFSTHLYHFESFKNFVYDSELKKYVFPFITKYAFGLNYGKHPEIAEKPNMLASFGVFDEKGKPEFLFPYLGPPFDFYQKFLPSRIYLHKAYNPKTKIYYYTSRYNNDILAVNLKDYSHFSFGHKVDTVKFIPPEDTSISAFDSLRDEQLNFYLLTKIQQNMFAGIRYDSHYNLLFQTYIVTDPEYRKKELEILSKVPSWKTCGTVVPPVKWEGKIRHYFTQVYTPEGKYLGTIKDHERYTPLMDDVIYQEGNTYWVRGPIKNGKWTIYKMKMDLEVE